MTGKDRARPAPRRRGWSDVDDVRRIVIDAHASGEPVVTVGQISSALAFMSGESDDTPQARARINSRVRHIVKTLVDRGELARLDARAGRSHWKVRAEDKAREVDALRRKVCGGDGSRTQYWTGPVDKPTPVPDATVEPCALTIAARAEELACDLLRANFGSRYDEETLGGVDIATDNAIRALRAIARSIRGLE